MFIPGNVVVVVVLRPGTNARAPLLPRRATYSCECDNGSSRVAGSKMQHSSSALLCCSAGIREPGRQIGTNGKGRSLRKGGEWMMA